MNLVTFIFCSVALLATQLLTADGIACYVCSPCEEPFKASDHTAINTTATTHCTKTVKKGVVIRAGSGDCTQTAAADNDVFCCNTDKCNGGVTKFGIHTAILIIAAASLVLLK